MPICCNTCARLVSTIGYDKIYLSVNPSHNEYFSEKRNNTSVSANGFRSTSPNQPDRIPEQLGNASSALSSDHSRRSAERPLSATLLRCSICVRPVAKTPLSDSKCKLRQLFPVGCQCRANVRQLTYCVFRIVW